MNSRYIRRSSKPYNNISIPAYIRPVLLFPIFPAKNPRAELLKLLFKRGLPDIPPDAVPTYVLFEEFPISPPDIDPIKQFKSPDTFAPERVPKKQLF